jgi:hypothetical protein
LAERFRDDNESGVHEAGEFFLDFDQSGTYGTGDGLFNGLLCQPGPGSGECATSQVTGIGDSGIIIMSGSVAVILDSVGGTLDLTGGGTGSVTFTISDVNSQPMPAGTTVTFTANNGSIVGPSDYTTPCTSFDGPLLFTFVVDPDTTTSSGAGVLEVTTPGPGVGSAAETTTIYFITIDD